MAQRKSPPGRKSASRLQFVCALMGFLVTASAIGVLARSAYGDRAPPKVSVQADSMRRSPTGWAVEVKIINNGDLTAAGVEIEGEAAGERVGTTLDYVPGHGEKMATLVFSSDARPNPRLRVLGWSDP